MCRRQGLARGGGEDIHAARFEHVAVRRDARLELLLRLRSAKVAERTKYNWLRCRSMRSRICCMLISLITASLRAKGVDEDRSGLLRRAP